MFIDFETHTAKYNMDFDEELLAKCEKEDIEGVRATRTAVEGVL